MNNRFFFKDNFLMILWKYIGIYICFRERERKRERIVKNCFFGMYYVYVLEFV